MHVATTRRHYKAKVYETHLLRRSYREGGKVRNETLANLSHLPHELIDIIRRSLRGETFAPADAAFDIVASRPHGDAAAVWQMMSRLELPELLGPACAERTLALALICARVVRPGSKLATTRWWRRTTLGSDLGVEQSSTDDVYQAMDWLGGRQAAIERGLAARHLAPGGIVLYDVSSSYVEGRHCPLAARGFPRDPKRGKLQIVYGLTTDPQGRPVAIEVFPGNTGDPTTFVPAVDKLRTQFGLHQVVMVGDRGMITKARIEALRPLGGVEWITCLRAPSIKVLVDTQAVQMSLFDEHNLAEITHPDYPGERLICCRNPALGAERARKREDLLAATEQELEKVAAAVRRPKRPFRGTAKIGLRVGKVLGRFKVGKHFVLDIADDAFTYRRDEEKIASEAGLDGIYVIRTSVSHEALSASEVVAAYKSLAQVEADFRSLKTVLLELRPIHHRLEHRVRAHALLCMLACYVAWHLRRAWAPLTFSDEEPPVRADPVSPAKRSKGAYRKASRRRRADGQPTESFDTLLEELATLTRSEVRVAGQGAGPTFEKLSLPTDLQRRAFELLEAPIPAKLA